MVRLENIKKTSNLIECDIIPEDSNSAGHLVVDCKKEELINCSLPTGYEWCTNHVSHALYYLLKIPKEQKIPNEKLIMWY